MNPLSLAQSRKKNRYAPSEPIKLHLVRYGGTVVWRLEKDSLPDENEVYKGPIGRFLGAWKLGVLLSSQIVNLDTKVSKERPTIQASAAV